MRRLLLLASMALVACDGGVPKGEGANGPGNGAPAGPGAAGAADGGQGGWHVAADERVPIGEPARGSIEYGQIPDVAVGASGAVHVAYVSRGVGADFGGMATRSPDGTWTTKDGAGGHVEEEVRVRLGPAGKPTLFAPMAGDRTELWRLDDEGEWRKPAIVEAFVVGGTADDDGTWSLIGRRDQAVVELTGSGEWWSDDVLVEVSNWVHPPIHAGRTPDGRVGVLHPDEPGGPWRFANGSAAGPHVPGTVEWEGTTARRFTMLADGRPRLLVAPDSLRASREVTLHRGSGDGWTREVVARDPETPGIDVCPSDPEVAECTFEATRHRVLGLVARQGRALPLLLRERREAVRHRECAEQGCVPDPGCRDVDGLGAWAPGDVHTEAVHSQTLMIGDAEIPVDEPLRHRARATTGPQGRIHVVLYVEAPEEGTDAAAIRYLRLAPSG